MKVSFLGGIGFPVSDRPDRPDPDGIVIAALLDVGMTLPQIVAAAVAVFPGQVDYLSTMSAITFFEDGEAKSFPEPLKKKLRAAARNASPVPVPEISYASIVASAAAVGR